MLADRYSLKTVKKEFLAHDEWEPFPPAADRNAWGELLKHPLNQKRRAYLVGQAERLKGKPWPDLPATVFMENVRTGNRTNWEARYFARRWNLSALAVAECLEYKGRFLDEIINGIWHITEEATWAINAHAFKAPHGDGQDPLPFQGEETLALFSLQTGAILSEIDYLLGTELESISAALRERIRQQVTQRLTDPFEGDEDTPAGGKQTRKVTPWMDGHNNWTPWCCTNLLTAAMHNVKDPDRLAAIAHRCMVGLDNFISHYGADGGCNEGPGYWSVAGGSMLRFLELLHSRSDGKISIYDEPLIREMGLYITRVNLSGKWFANFADAAAQITVPRALVWRYGERVQSAAMQDLVCSQMFDTGGEAAPLITLYTFMHMIRELTWIPGDIQPRNFEPEKAVWLPDLQVMVSRPENSDSEGLVLAAKGGHNNENHNHNDVGQFIILLDGEPVVVDPGTEAYTRFTFSDKRYTLWTHRSSGHNVPIINGHEQLPGEEFKATRVEYKAGRDDRTLAMNLEDAYPAEAGIDFLHRTIRYQAGAAGEVIITDAVELKEGPVTLVNNLFSPAEPEEREAGIIALGGSPRRLLLQYDPALTSLTWEPYPIEDARLCQIWKGMLYKLKLQSHTKSGEHRLRVEMKFTPEAES